MNRVKMTVRQIKNLGLWDKVCEYKNWNPWILNEGIIDYDQVVEFDTNFEKEKEMAFTKKELKKLNRLYNLFSEAESILLSMSEETQAKISSYHNEAVTLRYCIRWGLKASEDLNNEACGNQ